MIERKTLLENLKTNLKEISLEEFVNMFINKVTAVEEFYKLSNGVKAGNTISLLFNPHRLDTTTITSPVSSYGSLKDDNKLDGLTRLYLYNLEHNVANPFYIAIRRGYNGVQHVYEFPPYSARLIYTRYANKQNLKVLDPCAGWGGRMIGCASLNNTTYVGFEPSTKTYEGLLKLGEWLKSLNPTFNFKLYNLPFEDNTLNEKFDIALTSPPYFDTEHYSDEDTNSCNRYKTFDDWCEGFYSKLILKTIDLLDEDSSFILNVGARKYPLNTKLFEICSNAQLYCDEIEDYLSGFGEGKEKFYRISKKDLMLRNNKLF